MPPRGAHRRRILALALAGAGAALGCRRSRGGAPPRPQKGTAAMTTASARMPALFVGHGSPLNGIADNRGSRGFRALATLLPRPKAIVSVSAHWFGRGTMVTDNEHPPTIHDFGGFPQALFDMEYPAPSDP